MYGRVFKLFRSVCVCFHVLSCTFMCFHVLSCTFMYFHVLSCTFMYFHVLSCTFTPFFRGTEDILLKASPLNPGFHLRFITFVLTALHSCTNSFTFAFFLRAKDFKVNAFDAVTYI